MKFTHEDLSNTGDMWYITLECNGFDYHNNDIDLILKSFSNWKYREIAFKFGAYIEDDSGEIDYFFEEESDCIRCKNFLNDLINN